MIGSLRFVSRMTGRGLWRGEEEGGRSLAETKFRLSLDAEETGIYCLAVDYR